MWLRSDMHRYQLTADDLQPVVFEAHNSQLKRRLNTAFVEFTGMHDVDRALLYVHHPVHGWSQVCNHENTYLIIGNPLLLDNSTLVRAVMHTLNEVNRFPTEQQQQEKKRKALDLERQAEAERRRNAFRMIVCNPDKNEA